MGFGWAFVEGWLLVARVLLAVLALFVAACGGDGAVDAAQVCSRLSSIPQEAPDDPVEARRLVRAALEDAVGSGDEQLADAAGEVLDEWTVENQVPDLFGVTFRCAQIER